MTAILEAAGLAHEVCRATIGAMKSCLAAALALVLGACATPDSGDKSPDAYAGAPEQALIAEWAPPASVDKGGGIRHLSYQRQRSSYIPAATTFYQLICPPNVCVPLGGTRGFMLNEQCTTTFAVEDGKVKGWRREGTACGA